MKEGQAMVEENSLFSDDLFQEILCRLSVRKLLQLRCVSKPWCSLIDKHAFIMKHYHSRYTTMNDEEDVPYFADKPSIYGYDDPLHFYLLSKKIDNFMICLTSNLHRDSAPYFIDNQELFPTLHCAGVLNGVVLLHWFGEYLGLWNPATREFKVLPRPRPNLPNNVKEFVGDFNSIGFDSISNDLKIVRSVDVTTDHDDNESEKVYIHEVYSLRSNSWKTIEQSSRPLLYFHDTVSDGYFNGVQYWPVDELDRDTCSIVRTMVLSFEFSTEVFRYLESPPTGYEDESRGELCMAKYKESLALIFTDKSLDDNMCQIGVWVVTKFGKDGHGIPLCWEYLFSIGPIPKFNNMWFTAFLPDGDVLVTLQGGYETDVIASGHETVIYNTSTNTYKRLGVGLGCCLRYVESLFSFSKW